MILYNGIRLPLKVYAKTDDLVESLADLHYLGFISDPNKSLFGSGLSS